jgi:iron complex transport system substrate-binding protein
VAGCRGDAVRESGTELRVVSLHDVSTEIVVALGVTDRLVGVSEPVEVPEAARAALWRIPRADGAESILALHPTVVLGMAVVGEQAPELMDFLRHKGIDVWLGHPRTLEDVFGLVTAVASRLGVPAAGAAVTERLRERLGHWPSTREPPRVFVYDCCVPPFTAGRTSVLTDLIGRAGGRNIFADVEADWAKVSWEEVIARRPQLIVIHDYQYEGQGGVDAKRRKLSDIRSLAPIPVAVLPLGLSLGGVRSVEGLERLRAAIASKPSAPGPPTR